MKTINENIQIFNSLNKAQKYFNQCATPCHLLESFSLGRAVWFVDKSKSAIIDWPKHYILLNEK
jgi:hypothetical protein